MAHSRSKYTVELIPLAAALSMKHSLSFTIHNPVSYRNRAEFDVSEFFSELNSSQIESPTSKNIDLIL